MNRLPLLFLAAALLVGCSPSTPSATLAITHVNVLDVVDGSIQGNVTVQVSGDRILSIGPESPADDVPQVDGNGKFLIPGLWEMHMHVSLLGGPEILPLFTAYGITGVRDMGTPDSIFVYRQQVESGTRAGPRIVASGLAFVNYETGQIEPTSWSQGILSSEAAPDAVARLAINADFVKIQDSFTDVDTWLALAQEARSHGLPVAGHIPFSMNLEEAIAGGLTSIEHSLGLLPALADRETELRQAVMLEKAGDPYSALFAADAEAAAEIEDELIAAIAALMVEHGVALDANLKDMESMAYATTGRWNEDPRMDRLPPAIADSWRTAGASEFYAGRNSTNMQAALRVIPGVVSRLQDLGVMILAGTDAGAVFDFPGSDLHRELELLVMGGLTPLEALQAATYNPAVFMEMDDSLGTIAPGKLADLVLLNANPLTSISNTRAIHAVVQNGELFDRQALDQMLKN